MPADFGVKGGPHRFWPSHVMVTDAFAAGGAVVPDLSASIWVLPGPSAVARSATTRLGHGPVIRPPGFRKPPHTFRNPAEAAGLLGR